MLLISWKLAKTVEALREDAVAESISTVYGLRAKYSERFYLSGA